VEVLLECLAAEQPQSHAAILGIGCAPHLRARRTQACNTNGWAERLCYRRVLT
jgi:hypothetical protein